MIEVLTRFDWLGEHLSATSQRLAVTVVAAGLLVYVLVYHRRLRDRLEDRIRPLYADMVVLCLLVGTGVLTAAVVLGVWQQTGELQRLYGEIGLGGQDVPRIVLSLAILLTTIVVSRLTRRVIREVLDSSSAVTDHQRQVTNRLAQITIWAIAFVVVIGIWVEDLSGLLVGAGLIGAALGMAARQTIGSMLSGFVLMFSRPFEIGDWIEVGDSEGIVTEISIFNTRIRSFDGEYIMVPNDLVASKMVTNRSKRGRLRLDIDVGVDFQADVERVIELIEEAMDDLELALSAPEPHVVSKGFGDSSILLGARFWIDKPSKRRYWQARTDAVRAIKTTLQNEGVKIPYPQRELSGRAETGGLRIAAGDGEIAADPDDGEGGRELSMDSDDPDADEGEPPTPEDG